MSSRWFVSRVERISNRVVLDAGCSPRVRAAIQATFPSAPLCIRDVQAISAMGQDHEALSQAQAIVLAVRDQHGVPSTAIIERLRLVAPHVGIFVVEEGYELLDPWLRRLAVSGADDAFALDRVGDEKVLQSVLHKRVLLPPPELQLKELWSQWADCRVRTEAMYCVRNGYRPRHKFAPQYWFGFTTRAMRVRFNHAGLPTPLFLTRFGRELHWGEALEHNKQRRVELAILLGFETVTQFGVERRRVRKQAAKWPYLTALLDYR